MKPTRNAGFNRLTKRLEVVSKKQFLTLYAFDEIVKYKPMVPQGNHASFQWLKKVRKENAKLKMSNEEIRADGHLNDKWS